MKRCSITAQENRDWLLGKGWLKLQRYLRRNHNIENRDFVENLMVWAFPDEGVKLAQNDAMSDEEKKVDLIEWIMSQSQITCLILGDQRMGKDALICSVFEDIFDYCDRMGLTRPRIVTLGNVRKPPFVDEEDMYFSFKKVPFGTKLRPVFIYCSEIEQMLPARDTLSPENRLFSVLEGTLAQRHQKLFGAVKLASKVDINVIRSCNLKLFKYISHEKLDIEGVERNKFLTELGFWLLPKDVNNKSKTLLVFNNNLLTLSYGLPSWWSDEYSEQFRDVPIDKVWDYVETLLPESDKLTMSQINMIQTSVFQRFSKELSKSDIIERLSV